MNQKRFAIIMLAVIIAILVGAVAYLNVSKKPNPTSTSNNLIVSMNLRAVHSSPVLGGKPGIEIVVWASNGFPVRNEIAVLRIGNKEFALSRYPESGDTHTLIFTLTSEEFAQTATGDPVTVQYGRGGESNERWDLGTLDKSSLNSQTLQLPTKTLKELAAARGIRIGSNYDYELRSKTYDRIFEQEFNAMTVGFFRDVIYPGGSTAPVFSETDERVSRATALGMEVFGQTLVWFEEIPAWVKLTPLDQVEAAMFKHIDTLVSRYAGRVKLWNVVNEAIDDKGNIRLNHRWAEAMGADYISKAFVRAHAADPTAVLYYNDFDIESNQAKFEGVKALLLNLKNQGVPVHALGWQMHVKPGSFDPTILLARFNEIADMGLDNYVTELDVELPSEATAADYENQKQTYKTVVETFLAARRRKTLVIWGLRDGSPYWLTDKHPLLFDENFNKKPAYFGVQEALE